MIDWDHLGYSARGACFARLWMFTSNEPVWQAALLDAMDQRHRSSPDWGTFLLFAIYEVLRQSEHTFATAPGAPRTLAGLHAAAPAGARMVRAFAGVS